MVRDFPVAGPSQQDEEALYLTSIYEYLLARVKVEQPLTRLLHKSRVQLATNSRPRLSCELAVRCNKKPVPYRDGSLTRGTTLVSRNARCRTRTTLRSSARAGERTALSSVYLHTHTRITGGVPDRA
jgi:hypothetical protein